MKYYYALLYNAQLAQPGLWHAAAALLSLVSRTAWVSVIAGVTDRGAERGSHQEERSKKHTISYSYLLLLATSTIITTMPQRGDWCAA